jgi:hypothetical protein
MKKRRHRRRKLSASNLWLLLLLSTRPQLPPPLPTMLLWGQKAIIVMIRGPIRRLAAAMVVEVALVSLRMPHRRPRCWGKQRPRCWDRRVSRTPLVLHCYFSISFMQGSWDGDVKLLGHLNTLCVWCTYLVSFLYFCYVLDVICRSFWTVIVLFNPKLMKTWIFCYQTLVCCSFNFTAMIKSYDCVPCNRSASWWKLMKTHFDLLQLYISSVLL